MKTKGSVGLMFILLTLAADGKAQAPAQGTVDGTGTVEVKKQPDFVRIQIEILAKGKDLKEALQNLKLRREAGMARLASMGASKETIVLGEAGMLSEKGDPRRQFESMVAGRFRPPGAKPSPKSKETPPVSVSVSLKADLPLKTSSVEEMLFHFQEIQDKVKAADISGLKEFEKLSPQEEELAEESQAMQQFSGNSNEPKRGEPMFVFVSKVSDQERAKAQAEAFQKARHEASLLAKAAGIELGRLSQLRSHAVGAANNNGDNYYYARALQSRLGPLMTGEPDTLEAIGLQPGPVTLRVSVSASFFLKESLK